MSQLFKCSWKTKIYNELTAAQLLDMKRYNSEGCSIVYANVALNEQWPGVEGLAFRALFVKMKSVREAFRADGYQRRRVEEDGVWHLPGCEISENDKILDCIWAEVNVRLGLNITKFNNLISREVVLVDAVVNDTDGLTVDVEKKVLVLTFGATHGNQRMAMDNWRYVKHR